jgi:DNA-binding CsgD family transcriptional regulator
MTQLAELLLREVAAADQRRDVLLDLERDGVRCVIVRSHPVPAAPPSPAPAPELLSPREREIARMVADGLPNKTIAAVLDISAWTVNAHLRRAFTKLGVTSRAAMVAKLLKRRG